MSSDRAHSATGSGAPFGTLSETELKRVAEILREHGALGDSLRIAYLGLDEPDRQDVAAGRSVPRRARVQLLDVESGRARAITVDLGTGALAADVESELQRRTDRCRFCKRSMHSSANCSTTTSAGAPRWPPAVSTIRAQSRSPASLPGVSRIEGEERRRMARVLGHHQPTPTTMPWAHPIDGLVAFVDVGSRIVTDVIDTGAVPIPQETADYHVPGTFGPERTTQKPIVIQQPEAARASPSTAT